MLKMIVAVERELGIGLNNLLPWNVPADLEHFKVETSGARVVMGSSTYESLPFKPLPNRENVVLSRRGRDFQGAIIASSVDEVLGLQGLTYIIGGASVYEQFMGLADEIVLTRLNLSVKCDTFFPEFSHLYTLKQVTHHHCEKSGVDFSIERWRLS